MKNQIIITIMLLIAIGFATAFYFRNLSSTGIRAARIMRNIPANAAQVFEFTNEKSFYAIYKENKLFALVLGKQKLDELSTLQQLIKRPEFNKFFDNINIYISVHPSKTNTADLLFTVSFAQERDLSFFDHLSKQTGGGLIVTSSDIGKIKGYTVYISQLKERLYIIGKGDNIFSASFSFDLIKEVAASGTNKSPYLSIPDQPNTNSLASLYTNFHQACGFFNKLLISQKSDIVKDYGQFDGTADLNLNYRTDALMFNGTTYLENEKPGDYQDLFLGQQPVVNHLKDIFPSTTAYCTNYSVSDPIKFENTLQKYYDGAGFKEERGKLFGEIKSETGVNAGDSFEKLLGDEFAVITTRFFEKFAIIAVKDGSRVKELLGSISNTSAENTGRFNYDKLPFFLLGEPFSVFRKPYFMVIDNYLVLANSANELTSYYDSYINRKFLSQNHQYNQFDDLLAGKSNIAFLLQFKNTQPIFEREFKRDVLADLAGEDNGWKKFYAVSWQFAAADKNFYTNFCMSLKTDTTVNNRK